MRLAVGLLLPVLLLTQTDSERLYKIFAEEHAEFLRDAPRQAWVDYGVRDGAGKWTDESLEARTRRREQRSRPGNARPGWFYVNTYKLESRPKYEMEALTLHESVPGHHLQLALQRELTNVPEFRARAQVNAFSEGWGLYAESLGEEMGFYRDPYSKFGQLSMEIWRACRLVVDTGMHALGWPRQRAIDFMKENTGLTEHNVVTEIDRYIDEPGQALAYKIGELKIKELRRLAEGELGPRFSVRAFHDAVLANGSIPLVVLEVEIRRWIDETKASK